VDVAFYFERSRRYRLFDSETEHTFLERLTELEKVGLEFRYRYEGYIVSLDERATTFSVKDAKIRVLTAADFDKTAFPMLTSFSTSQDSILSDIEQQQENEERENTFEEEEEMLSNVVQRLRTAALPLPVTTPGATDSSKEPVIKKDIQSESPHNEQKKRPKLSKR
jgi:hypothetical protein